MAEGIGKTKKMYGQTLKKTNNTDLGDRPIVLIRFNPDDYIDKSGTKMASSFKYLKRGIPQINNLEEWQKRLKSLKETIDFHINNVPEEQVTTINLFYDGF